MKKSVKCLLSLMLAFMLLFAMSFSAFAASDSSADIKARALKQLGLFQGVSTTEDNFALDRAPTRTEALIMLIRVLGKDAEALSMGGKHPFTDVPAWADKYIGYAYEKGLTKGTSATTFGTGTANSDMYLTFMLRALGYSDIDGDFTWDAPDLLAKAVGILPEDVDTDNFLRADVTLISWAALESGLKSGSNSLSKKLIEEGVFSGDDYGSTLALVNKVEPTPVSVSTLDALKTTLTDKSTKAISIDAVITVTGELTIPAGVSVTVNHGKDLYVEGTLINNGTINVMGADSSAQNFDNYAVMSIQNGGKFINNGMVNLQAAFLDDTDDHGPIGGTIRLFEGSFTNNGSVFLQTGLANTHGGVLFVIGSSFANYGLVIVDGFQVAIIDNFINYKGGVVINNTYIGTRGDGKFTNNGTLTGHPIIKE